MRRLSRIASKCGIAALTCPSENGRKRAGACKIDFSSSSEIAWAVHSGTLTDMERRMSGEREIKRRRPGFGKRGSARVKLAERKPSSMGHLTQICRRWWGKKELQGKMAKKGFGFKRSRLEI